MAAHSSPLAWKIPWTEEPGGPQSMGSLRVGHDWETSLSCIGEGNGNPLQCSSLENPRDGGAWWAAIYEVAQTEHDWSDLAAAASWRPTLPFKMNRKKEKKVIFFVEDWNEKIDSREISRVKGKFGLWVQNEAGQWLTEFCYENTLVVAKKNFKQHNTTDDSTHGHHQIDYVIYSQRWVYTINSANTRLGADWSSDHELLIAKFRFKLEKVGENTRPSGMTYIKSLMII